ncbi:unnamed protein product [Chrysoparadoxa australica]
MRMRESKDDLSCCPSQGDKMLKKDVFHLSRALDSSSHFRLSLPRLPLAATDCSICLEVCDSPIELLCGHSFCRSCLSCSAAFKHSACALCRQEQIIDPEVLQAKTDMRRRQNLQCRLQSMGINVVVRAPKTKMKRLRTTSYDNTDPHERAALHPLDPLPEGWQEGKPEVLKPAISISALNKLSSMIRDAGSAGDVSVANLRQRWLQAHNEAGIGAVQCSELTRQWATPLYLATSRDVGATALRKLQPLNDSTPKATGPMGLSSSRDVVSKEGRIFPSLASPECMLMYLLFANQGGSSMRAVRKRARPVMKDRDEGVGSAEQNELARRLNGLVALASSPSVGEEGVAGLVAVVAGIGAATPEQLADRFTSLACLGALPDTAGAALLPTLCTRVDSAHEGVGAAPKQELSERLLSLLSMAALPDTAGTSALSDIKARRLGSQTDDAGAASLEQLSGRLSSLLVLALSAEAGETTQQQLRSTTLSEESLSERWSNLKALASSEDVGGLAAGALSKRWACLASSPDNAGALPASSLASRWAHVKQHGCSVADDAGASGLGSLSGRWEAVNDAGALPASSLAFRWAHVKQLACSVADDAGASGLGSISGRWEAVNAANQSVGGFPAAKLAKYSSELKAIAMTQEDDVGAACASEINKRWDTAATPCPLPATGEHLQVFGTADAVASLDQAKLGARWFQSMVSIV